MTYKVQVPDLELTSSDTDLLNWVLYLEAQKAWKTSLSEPKGTFRFQPMRPGNIGQGAENLSNSLTYRWVGAGAHLGYFLHSLLKPYIGIYWAYSKQQRSDFEKVGMPGVIAETAPEEFTRFL